MSRITPLPHEFVMIRAWSCGGSDYSRWYPIGVYGNVICDIERNIEPKSSFAICIRYLKSAQRDHV